MQLPVDIKALIDETTNLKSARETEISVSVYIDPTAPNDVVAHVRNAFASSLPTVRMTITYIGANFVPQPTDDVAIIVAGTSPDVGKCAQDLREVGVPVMVATTLPKTVAQIAQEAGYAIPDGDIVAPDPQAVEDPQAGITAQEVVGDATTKLGAVMGVVASAASNISKEFKPEKLAEAQAFAKLGAGVSALKERFGGKNSALPAADATALATAQEEAEMGEPLQLTDALARSLDKRMGRWIVSVCREKRLAYAIAFPFVRRPLARDTVQATSMQNAAVGLVVFLPGADLPIMTLNQAKMVLQIAAAYGLEMDKERLKELVAVVGNAYVCRSLVRKVVGVVPVLGVPMRTGVAYGGTAALGYAIIEYFEGGQNVTGVANVIEHAAAKGTKLFTSIQSAVEQYAPPATDEQAH